MLLLFPVTPSSGPPPPTPTVDVYVATLAGVPVSMRNGTCVITETANGSNSCECLIDSPTGTLRPAVGDEWIITENDVRIFGGFVSEPSESTIAENGATVGITTSLRAEDFNQIATRRYLNQTIPAGTLKAALITIVGQLVNYDITLSVTQPDGPLLPPLEYEDKRIDEALNDLTVLSGGYVWNIDYNKILSMPSPSGGVTSPFNVVDGDGNALGDITVQPQFTEYANYIIVRAGTGIHNVTDSFTGDGATSNFVLTTPFVSNGSGFVQNGVDGANVPVLETFAVQGQGFDNAVFWLYYAVDNTIRRVPGAGPPAAGNAIVITYQAQFPIRRTADGAASPPDRIEKVISEPDIFDPVVAQSMADQYLIRLMTRWKNIKYMTRQKGVHPTQVQHITASARNINSDCLITDVTIRHVDGVYWTREVQLVQGLVYQGSWRDTIKEWNGGTTSFSGGTSVVTITQGGVGGSGTIGKLAKWIGSAFTLGDSRISESGLNVTIDNTLTVANINSDNISTVGLTASGTVTAATLQGSLNSSFLTGTISTAVQDNITRVGTIVSGVWNAGAGTFAGNVLPALTSTYDLGSSSLLWRKAFISQLEAVLFVTATQTIYGGWLSVNKGEGVLPTTVFSDDTDIDFGQTMVLNQFVLIRARELEGNITEEYMKVGAHVTGTTYTVTRNLSGIGPKNWAQGTPYAIRGVAGDGWVELNAFDTPRMSIFSQGSAYNNSSELIRIGYLTGMPNSSSGIGAYMGDASSYFRWDGTALTLVSAGCTIDAGGLTLGTPTSFTSSSAVKFNRVTTGGFGQTGDINSLHAEAQAGSPYTTFITLENTIKGTGSGAGGANGDARISLIATGWNNTGSGSSRTAASLYVESGTGGSIANITATTIGLTGGVVVSGLLTTNGQVAFPATQNASADANTLDDYEESTWTPSLVSTGGGSCTYTTQTATSIKIGRFVFFSGRITVNVDSLNAGNITISGLPYTVDASYYGTIVIPFYNSVNANIHTIGGYVVANSTTIQLTYGVNTGNIGIITDVQIANGIDILFSGHYMASA